MFLKILYQTVSFLLTYSGCVDEKRSYSLKCINVERDLSNFRDLQQATSHYGHLVTNIHGAFADNIDQILQIVKEDSTVVCFLDPFGIDGIDWNAIQRLIRRRGKVDFWIRFDLDSLRRRFGHYTANQSGSDKQFDILCRVYGINDRRQLYQALNGATPEISKTLALNLYLTRLRDEYIQFKRSGYADAYKIESLEGEEKYYLVYASMSPKGIVLASDIVYGVEEVYQKDLQEYKASQTRQMSFLSEIMEEPSDDEVLQQRVDELKLDIWNACKGKKLTVLDIHAQLLPKWFGRIKKPHINRALKQMYDSKDRKIVEMSGAVSNDNTEITFKLV